MNQITVVIPVYNSIQYLKNLTACLENQVYTSFTVVFVDDCSTDGSAIELRKIRDEAHFSSLVVSTETNSGAGVARNVGMRWVKTPYFCFVDADDFISANYLQELYSKAVETGADVVFSHSVRYWNETKQKPTSNYETISRHLDDKKYITACADFGPWAKLMATSLWDERTCGFPGEIRGEDGATIPVLYHRAEKFSVCKEAIYYYYQTPNSRSRSVSRHYADSYKAWQILSERLPDDEVLEYKFIMAVGYGVIRNAIRYGVENEELERYCVLLREKYPKGLSNRFFREHPVWQKKIFVRVAYRKMLFLLKIMVRATG